MTSGMISPTLARTGSISVSSAVMRSPPSQNRAAYTRLASNAHHDVSATQRLKPARLFSPQALPARASAAWAKPSRPSAISIMYWLTTWLAAISTSPSRPATRMMMARAVIRNTVRTKMKPLITIRRRKRPSSQVPRSRSPSSRSPVPSRRTTTTRLAIAARHCAIRVPSATPGTPRPKPTTKVTLSMPLLRFSTSCSIRTARVFARPNSTPVTA